MRAILLAFAFATCATPVLAGVARPAVGTPHYTCTRPPVSRVGFVEEPASCCVGHIGCPQLLSNTGLVKPKRSNRT